MKTNSALIGCLLVALLAGCEKKQEAATTRSDPPKPAETHLKPVAEKRPSPAPALPPSLPSPDAGAAIAGEAQPPTAPATPAGPAAGNNRQATREQRLERATQMFAGLDKNGDGKLTKDEVTGRMQRRFDDMDTNKDGVVDDAEQKVAAERMADRQPRRRGNNNNGGGVDGFGAAFGAGGGGNRGRRGGGF
jgi:hypothetical protein